MHRPEFVNHRMEGESFKAYRARRRYTARAVKQHLKGRLAFESSRLVQIPGIGIDAAVDAAVLRGLYRDLTPTFVDGKPVRIGRTKGVSFRYPVPRAEARAAALQASREARA